MTGAVRCLPSLMLLLCVLPQLSVSALCVEPRTCNNGCFQGWVLVMQHVQHHSQLRFAHVRGCRMTDTKSFASLLCVQVEARLARREEARAREDSPDLVPVAGGGSIMGGDDSFAAAKAR